MIKTPTLPYIFCIFALLALTACSDDDPPPLEGERISVMELQKNIEPDDPVLESQGLVMPQSWANDYWPQAGGYPNHSMQNLSLKDGALNKAWSVSIGDGSSDEIPLITQPVVFDGRVFTVDTDANLSAFDTQSGKRLWRTDIAAEY